VKTIRFSSGFSDVFPRAAVRNGKKFAICGKKTLFPVDGHFSLATLLTPPEAGPDLVGVVLAYFGTANWNSILSRHDKRQPATAGGCEIIAGDQIGFFCWAERGANRWFFDIYIQGSKYNF
jgi:hypothetical protein